MEDMNFEPFFDYESVDERMASDLHSVITDYRKCCQRFESNGSVVNAVAVMKAQDELQHVYEAIKHSIFTVPALVHVAGPKKVETHPESGNEATVQRCSRCGSVIQLWHEHMIAMTGEGPRELDEDEVPWWKVGDVVAKCNHPAGMNLYEIENRPLKRHERECVDMSMIENIFRES
jgi:ribosomal protein S27AE